MTKRDVVSLAVRILGVYSAVAFIFYIPQLMGFFGFFTSEGGPGFWVLFLIVLDITLYGLMAWYLITRADVVGSWVYPEDEPQTVVFMLDREIALQIAVMGIGVYLLARGIVGFPGAIVSITWKARFADTTGLVDSWMVVLQVVLQIGIGLGLTLGPRGLMRVIEHLRRA